MRKAQAVHRATWAGAGALLGAAALARRHPVAAVGVLAAAALAGVAAFSPRNPAMGRTLSRGPAGRPRAALTFDDGPGPSTPDVLDALAQRGRARHLLRARPPGRAPPGPRAADGRRGPPDRQPRLRPRHPDLPRHAPRGRPARAHRAGRRGRGGRGRDEPALPRAPRLPRAGDGARRSRRAGYTGRRLDAGRLRLGRARRGGDRAPGGPRARAGHDPAAPRRRRLGARAAPPADGRRHRRTSAAARASARSRW